MGLGKNGYWNDNALMSFHEKPIKAALTFRGPGKSYGRKFKIMNRALQHDETTLCLYREPQDLKFARQSWITPLVKPALGDKQHHGYEAKKFKIVGDKTLSALYYDKKPICQFLSLNSVNATKQLYFNPNTCWVWMDEFIPIRYEKLRGISDEGDAFQYVVDTIDHDYKDNRQDYGLPPVRCILYGNPVNEMSPLVEYLGIDPFKYGIYSPKDKVIVEHIKPGKKQMSDPNCIKDVRNFMLSQDKLAYVKEIPKGAKPWLSVRMGDNERYYTIYNFEGVDYVCQNHRHVGENRYGIAKNHQKEEQPFHYTFNDYCNTLQTLTIGCNFFYDSYITKINFLNDIMHPGI